MLVKQLKERDADIFDKRFLDCLPETCLYPSCGSPTEISEVLTGLKCTNPRCISKLVKRMTMMMSAIGVKDLGKSRAEDFLLKFGIDNPLLIFGYEPDVDGPMGDNMSMDLSMKIFNQLDKKRSFTLWEFVRFANLPYIQNGALQIFGDFDSLEDAYTEIEDGSVEYIRKCLGISRGTSTTDLEEPVEDISIRALKVYESLMTFKKDLFDAFPYVKIIKINSGSTKTLKAVCSSDVGSTFKTKADFYATVNGLFNNIHVEFLSSVSKNIDYLIWAGADGTPKGVTNKVAKVRAYNDKYEKLKASGATDVKDHYIPIVTAEQFIKILEEMQ